MVNKSAEERGAEEKGPEPEKKHTEHTSELGSQAKEAVEKVYNMAKNVKRDTLAYIVMAAGLITLWWWPHLGGALVGIVFGANFSNEMLNYVKSFNAFLEREGPAKSIILGGAVLAILIVAPAMVLGALAAIGVVALLARLTV